MAFTRGLPGLCSAVGLQAGRSLGPRQNPVCVDTRLISNSGWRLSREEANTRRLQPGQVTTRSRVSNGADGEADLQEVTKTGQRCRCPRWARDHARLAGAAGLGPAGARGGLATPALALALSPQPASTPDGGKRTLHTPASVLATGDLVVRLWQPPVTWRQSQLARCRQGGPAGSLQGHPQSSCAGGRTVPVGGGFFCYWQPGPPNT